MVAVEMQQTKERKERKYAANNEETKSRLSKRLPPGYSSIKHNAVNTF